MTPSPPHPIVTTARRPDSAMALEARALAERVGGAYVERDERSIPVMQAETPGAPVVVVENSRIVCHHEGEVFFFHPGMARMRFLGGPDGTIEPLIVALDLHEGDTLIDATLGLAGDAILAADAVGDSGRVIGLETNPVIAELTRLGLASYSGSTQRIRRSMRRITVVCADHLNYLQSCPDGSVDVVFFDPMFDKPLRASQAMDPLRTLASHTPLSPEALQEAARVARRRVVIKSRRKSSTLQELGVEEFFGGKGSRVVYGIIRCE